MDKKSVLIVGFGVMGCRHAQSFLDKKKDYEVHILEPSDESIKQNIKRIGAEKSDFIWYKNIDNIPLLDIAIIATSSYPRFEIVKNLIKMGYKKFLLEKVVFQSEKQFSTIIKMIDESDSVAYCNFVNRYFVAYNNIKKQLDRSNKKININVLGGALQLGLGCNAIHYIDILQYLTNNDEIQLTDSLSGEIGKVPVFAYNFSGTRYDCGTKLGYIKANTKYALKNNYIGEEYKYWLKSLIKDN